MTTPLFKISQDVYDKAGEMAQIFFYYQRCGTNVQSIVPDYFGYKACHLDDGLYFNGSDWIYKNLTGGWHDAGDYNKYMEDSYNTQFSTFTLTLSY
ncbi:MAG: glycoside hydrolase family 9 protein [Promethearchaeota archaeon]